MSSVHLLSSNLYAILCFTVSHHDSPPDECYGARDAENNHEIPHGLHDVIAIELIYDIPKYEDEVGSCETV